VTVTRATFSAAGEMQADVNEVGPEHVAESNLRRAMRRALQMQLGPVVVPEGGSHFKLDAWPGRLGDADLAVFGGNDVADRAYIELKWCRRDKVWEVLWDLLKLALAVAEGRGEFAYLRTGAPVGVWEKPAACADLFSPGSWSTEDLFARHAREWGWLLAGNRPPGPCACRRSLRRVPSRQLPSTLRRGADWERRAVGLAPVGRGWTSFDQGWPRSQAQSLAE
jgi:hypothetical protein